MLRNKPTLKLGVCGSIDVNPDQERIESKLKDEFYCKRPVWDVPREGLQHETIEIERDLFEISTQQEVVKKKTAINEKLEERRINNLHEAQLKLHNKFIKSNEFIRECEGKTARAENQIENELKQQEILKESIETIENELNELSTFEKTFEGIVKEMQPYETVLIEAIEKSSTFKSIEDFMKQCDTIMLAQVEIAERGKEFVTSVELIRQKMLESISETSKMIIVLKTKLADLELYYNEAKIETLKWEKILSKTKDEIADHDKETIMLTDSIKQLYHLLAKRNGSEDLVLYENSVAGQLDFIRDEIEILKKVIKRAQLKMAQELVI